MRQDAVGEIHQDSTCYISPEDMGLVNTDTDMEQVGHSCCSWTSQRHYYIPCLPTVELRQYWHADSAWNKGSFSVTGLVLL